MRWFLYNMQYSGNPKWPLHAFDYDTYTNFSMDSRNDLINFENIDILMHLLYTRQCIRWCESQSVSWSVGPTPCHPMNCSLPGSSVHGILQARILQWVAISFSRGSSQIKDWTGISCVSCIAGWFFTCWAIGKPTSAKTLFPNNITFTGSED